ncbi:MAG: DUF3987 domain-containing protein, partial [Acidobacteria bacterium]|nr:DUF3987 domain-containing protein [Acidobacteriota bacterium]
MVDLSPAALDAAMTTGFKWNPHPLRRYERPEPYPVHCFPPIIRDAVDEVSEYVKAPVAMVAGCALSAVSASIQSRFSVARDSALIGPASLYVLTVADSGERKSTIDKMMMLPIREWEAEQAKAAEPLLAEYRANLEQWEIAGSQLKSEMRKSAYEFHTGDQFNPLVSHELAKPKPPRIPRMLRGDDTPEALAVALAEYP